MSEETVVAASSAEPVVMEIERGPLVNMTSEQRQEYRRTGDLPGTPKKTEEAATSSVAPKAEPEGESDPPKQQETPKAETKPKPTAEERIAQLEATIEKIRKGSGKETPKAESSPAEPKPVQQHPPTRPKPTAEDKKEDGSSKFDTYEDFVEDLSDWKAEQRDVQRERDTAQQVQAKSFNDKLESARTRYPNFDDVMKPTVDAIVGDNAVSPVVKQMLDDSEVLPDLIFTIGSSESDLANFLKMAKDNPGKALRYIALTESLIADELAGTKPADEAPVRQKTQVPKPPSEAGGRAATPPDALEAAAKAGDFRAYKAESLRRDLARLKG